MHLIDSMNQIYYVCLLAFYPVMMFCDLWRFNTSFDITAECPWVIAIKLAATAAERVLLSPPAAETLHCLDTCAGAPALPGRPGELLRRSLPGDLGGCSLLARGAVVSSRPSPWSGFTSMAQQNFRILNQQWTYTHKNFQKQHNKHERLQN
jgi:hypothetical protein